MATTETTVRVRRAASYSVCAAPGCIRLIEPQQTIEHVPGTGWAHIACARASRDSSIGKASQ